jgi:hypothetical protein
LALLVLAATPKAKRSDENGGSNVLAQPDAAEQPAHVV